MKIEPNKILGKTPSGAPKDSSKSISSPQGKGAKDSPALSGGSGVIGESLGAKKVFTEGDTPSRKPIPSTLGSEKIAKPVKI